MAEYKARRIFAVYTAEMMFDDSSSEDDMYFSQKALYVEPPTRHIDLSTIPQDGSEFIHKSRLLEDLAVEAVIRNPKKSWKVSAKKMARVFSSLAAKLKTSKALGILQKKFPKKTEYFYKKKNDKDWCLFLFGSEICAEIYGKCKKGMEGHLPVLSCVIYFSQVEIQMIIKLIYQWFLMFGMKDEFSMWLYALLACLDKPVDDDFQEFLEEFRSECKKYVKEQNPADKYAYFISVLLAKNFCAN
ncbi:uncharacterized protein NPIL_610561 [Nephila pilipes]|uniref:Gem-associated protein 2 n=1 Tax=Nephila pilipes TaxID=299642 RepID=A0A8X6QRR2_NEPPI|nr:uncharacterized protein NPIL_610561 [Nephila pilipes]